MDEEADLAVRRLRYALTRDDLVACAFQTARLDFPMRAMLTLMVAAAGLVIAGLPETMDPFLWWSITVGLLVLALSAGVVVPTWHVRRKAARVPAPKNETVLEDRETRLVVVSDGKRREVPLGAITDVLFGPQHLFLQRRNETMVVPLRAFDDLDDMNRFGLELSNRSSQARQATAPGT